MSIDEAIAVFDKSASRTTPNAQTQAWEVLRAHITDLRQQLQVAENELAAVGA